MIRFVIMQFVEGLQSVAPDRYIFKGGNLLWHSLDPKWINKQIKEAWVEYTQKKVHKNASDLPKDIAQLIDTTNKYLFNVTKLAK